MAPALPRRARTVTLLHMRDIETRLGERFSVSEMLDDRNRELAEVTKGRRFHCCREKLLKHCCP